MRIAYISTVLDNPAWSSLTTAHATLALGTDAVRRYPADVAPFLAVERSGTSLDERLVPPGDTALLIGPRPTVPVGWQLEDFGVILQMVCEQVPAVPDGPAVVELTSDAQRADVHALAALVYPHYFRPRTTELGRYFGIYAGGRLAAMAGERMGFPGHREISAVCAHPDFVGRGLARRVLAFLGANIAAGGALPFLHVAPTNTRASALYEQNGYRPHAHMPFAALRRGRDGLRLASSSVRGSS
jgi:GNAT superfamily N-acetyltransferase